MPPDLPKGPALEQTFGRTGRMSVVAEALQADKPAKDPASQLQRSSKRLHKHHQPRASQLPARQAAAPAHPRLHATTPDGGAAEASESELQLMTPCRADDKQEISPSASVATQHPFAALAAKAAVPMVPLRTEEPIVQAENSSSEQEPSFHLQLDLDLDSD